MSEIRPSSSDRRRAVLAAIVRLHHGVAIATAPLLVLFHGLGTLPAVTPLLGLLIVALAFAVLVEHRATARLAAGRPIDGALATLAFVDTCVLAAAIHVGGGPDAAGLPFFVLPSVVFAGLLPRRATAALASFAAVTLALDFAAYDFGWLGLAATASAHTTTWSRYGAVVMVSVLAAAVTATLGERWRAQERAARQLANERGRVGELQARIVATVSHELRTPLSVIQAAAGTLGRYGDRMTAAERTWRLKKIEDSVQATTRLIEDVLPLGGLGEGDQPPPHVDLADVAAALVADMQAAAPETVRLDLAVARGAPTAWVDPRLARRALRDLLANAIRYSPGGGTIRLAVTADPEDRRHVLLRVRDEGMGIPPEDRPFVFEPFYRGRNVDGLPGLGVGLSIAKREVELMHGTLVLEPSERGASFVVRLPVGRHDDTPSPGLEATIP